MTGYKVFSLSDTSQEAITTRKAESLTEAENAFAKIKRLPIQDFKKIYGVSKI